MKKPRRLIISPQAIDDIQQVIDYYNTCQKGLGKRFHSEVKKTFSSIQKTPSFQIRYDEVRCCPVRVFPFMIHYTFEDEIVFVWGIKATALNPEKYWIRSK
jgi:toxin ParE1/3/4